MAHLLLAGDEPEAMVGQVLADFVTAGEIASFAPGIQAGIRAHQRIDAFADGHAVFDRARRRLQPPYRRFGGILLDIYFDHFLAKTWDRHGDGGTLAAFANRSYRILHEYRDLPSERFRLVVAAMRRDDWLAGYAKLDGVDRALRGLSARFPRANPMATGGTVLRDQYDALAGDFEELFPPLVEHARSLRGLPPGRPSN